MRPLDQPLSLFTLTFADDVDVGAGLDDGGLDEPRQAEAHQDIEHVGPHSVGHRHVAITVQIKVSTFLVFVNAWNDSSRIR